MHCIDCIQGDQSIKSTSASIVKLQIPSLEPCYVLLLSTLCQERVELHCLKVSDDNNNKLYAVQPMYSKHVTCNHILFTIKETKVFNGIHLLLCMLYSDFNLLLCRTQL